MDEKRWCLISDDDGHLFLCPAERREEAENMFGAYYEWQGNYPDGNPPALPDFVERIDGYAGLTFTDPR